MDGSKPMNSPTREYLKAEEASKGSVRVVVENGPSIAKTNELSQSIHCESWYDFISNIGTVLNMNNVESTNINNYPEVILGTLVVMVGHNPQEWISS